MAHLLGRATQRTRPEPGTRSSPPPNERCNSLFVTFLTLVAEVDGVALALELATSVNYLPRLFYRALR